MNTSARSFRNWLAACVLVASATSGLISSSSAAGPVIRSGDLMEVDFTCRFPNGELAAATDPGAAEDPKSAHSTIFIPRKIHDPLVVTAGIDPSAEEKYAKLGFEGEILRQISAGAVGLEFGKPHELKIADDLEAVKRNQKDVVKIPRKRQRDKLMKVSLAEYQERFGTRPEVGQEITLDPVFPGKVIGLTETEALVTILAEPGSAIDTPFGKGVIQDLGDKYQVLIVPRNGDYIRYMNFIGRVSSLDEESMTIDFSRPLGGETLSCEIVARKSSIQATPKTDVQAQIDGDSESSDAASYDGAQDHPHASHKAAADQSGDASPDSMRVPSRIEAGDFVKVNYTLKTENGEVIATTIAEIAGNGGISRHALFQEYEDYAPEEIVAGKDASLPGLSKAVLDMVEGGKKSVVLKPEEAFGNTDPKKTMQFPLVRKIPFSITMMPEEFYKRFGQFPVVGKELGLDAYTRVKVSKVQENTAVLKPVVKKRQTVKEPFGTVEIVPGKDDISITLHPVIGSGFEVQGRKGMISVKTDKDFTVDFNHPLAGKKVIVDLEIVVVNKASVFAGLNLAWEEDHDKGLQRLKQEKKPGVLLLYADWCGWCKRLLSETMVDPRIKNMKDEFVWMKINSDKEKRYKSLYGQNGFPLMVFINPNGEVVKKLEGYKDARALAAEMKSLEKVL